jgi:hypothetical protein
VEEQGSWHTHPDERGIPSESDLVTWLNHLDCLERSLHVGLILTAEASDPHWFRPTAHGWVVRRADHSARTPYCEPAMVKTGRA